jgi:alpha-beta hydrolase superfamily lysophospholipase
MTPVPSPSHNPPSEHGTLAASDGLSLAWYRWDPAGTRRGTILLAHGLGEHAGRYGHVARAFTQAGFVVLAYDARGHGRSGGPRGHSPSHRQTLDDLDQVLKTATGRPRFAYGHSMGGQQVLSRGLENPDGLDGVIATSPWFRLAFPAPRPKVFLGRALQSVVPAVTLASGLDQPSLSRDPAVVAAYASDPLVHDRISFRLGLDLLDGGQRLLSQAEAFRLPVLLMHGSADCLIDPEATRLFYEDAASLDKTLRVWPGLLHETHNEPEWQDVVQVSTGWALAHAG